MNKKTEVCYEFMNKLPLFFDSKDRSFLMLCRCRKKFSVRPFYDKKKFKDIDDYVDKFLEKLKKRSARKKFKLMRF